MKILHTADWHGDNNYEAFIESTEHIKNYIVNNDIDLMCFSGDLFDSKIIASDLYNKIINRFIEFANLVPIFMVYGTPSHDYKGSLDILRTVKTKYPIHLVDSFKDSITYFNDGYKDFEHYTNDERTIRLIGCPWPLKSRLLTDKELLELNTTEQNELYKKRFNVWRNKIIKQKKENPLYTILVGHLQLIGSFASQSQDISSENHNPEDFYDLCDYGALGHIHKNQNFKHLHYSGSIYNKTWGEMEDKYFNVIDTDYAKNEKVKITKVKIPTPFLIKYELNLQEYEAIKKIENQLQLPNGYYIDLNEENVHLWIVVNVGEKKILNQEREEKFWNEKVDKIRLEFVKIKTETVQRLENYNKEISLTEKFILWCKQKSIEPTEFQINKIKELENV